MFKFYAALDYKNLEAIGILKWSITGEISELESSNFSGSWVWPDSNFDKLPVLFVVKILKKIGHCLNTLRDKKYFELLVSKSQFGAHQTLWI